LVYFFGQQEHAHSGRALHFIQITWFNYVSGFQIGDKLPLRGNTRFFGVTRNQNHN